jgi:hypothetical protein
MAELDVPQYTVLMIIFGRSPYDFPRGKPLALIMAPLGFVAGFVAVVAVFPVVGLGDWGSLGLVAWAFLYGWPYDKLLKSYEQTGRAVRIPKSVIETPNHRRPGLVCPRD